MKRYALLFVLLTLANPLIGSADYYIDVIHGDDKNNGLSPASAWQSLEKINKTKFKPGDTIRLRGGQVFKGQIRPQSSGEAGRPITLTSYFGDAKPRVDGEGEVEATLLLENLSHFVVDGLEITNTGPKPEPRRKGVWIRAVDAGVVRSIALINLFIHDVNGSISKDEGGGSGIAWQAVSKKKKTRFEGLLIENCHLLRCDRNAMNGGMTPWNDLRFLSSDVVVRGNLMEDIGGDGIVIVGADGALVEFNRLYGARQRIDLSTREMAQHAGASVGIWPWSSKNTHIRFNEVWGYNGVFDGQGFDSDWNCSGTLFEYNFSADNAGGFFLVCNSVKHQESGQSIGNTGTIIRHNVSFNDHLRGFLIGTVDNVLISGNIIYNTIEDEFPLVIGSGRDHNPDSVEIKDNLFYTRGKAQIYQGRWDESGLGVWSYAGPLKRDSIRFKGNAYSNFPRHEEPAMQQLNEEESLSSLIDRFKQDRDVAEGFRTLMEFLKDSRYSSEIAKGWN